MQPEQQQDLTRVLNALDRGDDSAGDALLPIVYDELRRLAAAIFQHERQDHTLQPTALVHEAYVRLIRNAPPTWSSRAHFMAIAARAMRQVLVDHAHRHRTQKRGGGRHRVTLHDSDTPSPASDVDLLSLDEALAKLEKLDPRMCRVVELRFFSGLKVEEAADVLCVSTRTVELDWRMARGWLYQELRERDA